MELTKIELGKLLVKLAVERLRGEMHPIDFEEYKIETNAKNKTDEFFTDLAEDAITDVTACFH